jgi:aquaporin Z
VPSIPFRFRRSDGGHPDGVVGARGHSARRHRKIPFSCEDIRMRRVVAESIGTFVLVFFGVGSAVFGADRIGAVGVALTFGLVLLALAYTLGPVSGCHVNPAVTLGVLLTGGIDRRGAGRYVAAQLLGAVVAGGLLRLLVTVGGITDQTRTLGTNGWGETVNVFGAFAVEVVLTFLLVFVVLMVTRSDAAPGFAGLAIGLVLTAIHLVGIPLTGTSVNPARSIGPALFAGGPPLLQLWLFVVAPLVGAVGAAAVTALVTEQSLHLPARAR